MLVNAQPEPAVAEDVSAAADLIRRRLARQNNSAEKTAVFGNLFSRLLTQPVLSQKWGILYFLLRVAEGAARAAQ